MSTADLHYLSAGQLGDAIVNRDISSLELTELHIRRIREVNPKLNAVFHLAEESADHAAKVADRELADGRRRSPLHGVPFTVKDWIEAAGMPCMANDERYRNHIPKRDATVVDRMIRSGCVLLGKTTMFDDSSIYGRTSNPYRLDCSPGGSSSGEAAIIAAGGSPLGLGSDSGGSIREPACPFGSEGGPSYCLPYSLGGLPAVVVRAGASLGGLSVGVQIVARPWCEHVALAVAMYIETEFGGWQPPPL